MDLLVVGAGEIGRWFAEVVESSRRESTTVAFADADPAAAEAAAADLGATAVSEPSRGAHDVVCVAVPIPAAGEAIERWAGSASDAVIDVTGTMATPVAAMREHAPDLERASLHPLFAPANEPGNVAVVTDAGGPTVEAVTDALGDRGNDLYETTPVEHDEAMRTVQARTHAAILAFGLAAQSVPSALQTPVSSELESLVEQVTDGEARVYADVQAAFDGAEDVADAARRIAEADGEAFEALYEDARR